MRYSNDRERARHLMAARRLAREIGVAEARAIEAYERELERLTAVARVKDYLEILVVKHVKIELSTRERELHPPRPERYAVESRDIRTDIIEEREAALVD